METTARRLETSRRFSESWQRSSERSACFLIHSLCLTERIAILNSSIGLARATLCATIESSVYQMPHSADAGVRSMDNSMPSTARTSLSGTPSRVFIAYDFEIGGNLTGNLARVSKVPPSGYI